MMFENPTISKPTHDVLALFACANSDGSGESTRMRRLVRAFTARILKVCIQMKTRARI